MSLTAFRDALPAGSSFPVGLERLVPLLSGREFAAYFVATATRAHQAFPPDSPRLPVLRIQRERPAFRVSGDRVAPAASSFPLHVLIYSVPATRRRAIADALAALPTDWLHRFSDQALVFHDAEKRLTFETDLPTWV